jgi:hypothetical protein
MDRMGVVSLTRQSASLHRGSPGTFRIGMETWHPEVGFISELTVTMDGASLLYVRWPSFSYMSSRSVKHFRCNGIWKSRMRRNKRSLSSYGAGIAQSVWLGHGGQEKTLYILRTEVGVEVSSVERRTRDLWLTTVLYYLMLHGMFSGSVVA